MSGVRKYWSKLPKWHFSRNPGIIVKAAGTCTELHVLEQTIQALNKRFKAESKKKVCVRYSYQQTVDCLYFDAG